MCSWFTAKWRKHLSVTGVIVTALGAGSIAARDAVQAPSSTTRPDGATASHKVSLSVQDRFEIHELFARYSQDLDMGTGSVLGPDDLVNNVFAPDGVFHDPSLCLIGSAELKKGLVSHTSHAKSQQHWPMNIVFTEGAGDHAKTHTYVIVFSGRGGSPATYHDSLVRIKGKWLIQDREVWRQGAVKHDPRCPTDLETLEP